MFIRDLLKLKQTVRLLEWVRLLETPEYLGSQPLFENNHVFYLWEIHK